MNHRHLLAGAAGLLLLAPAGCNHDDSNSQGGPGSASAASSPVPSASPASSASAPALALGEAQILGPADNSDVKQCAIFHGVANLPPDKTLILGVRNVDNGNPERYFEAVDDWEYADAMKDWKGAQYFGSKDTSAGQSFKVDLLIMNRAQATKAIRAASKDGWHSPDNPPGTTVAAHVTLKRVAGPGPAECS